VNSKTLRIGIAQIDCAVSTPDANLAKHLEYVERARQDKVDLLVFPELSLTGYPHSTVDIEALACTVGQGPVKQLAQAARGLMVVAGFVEEGPAAQFYNCSAVVTDGQAVYRHRKLNLATYGELSEGKLFAAGRYVETFSVGPWRASILTCADVWNPALVTLAALHGSTILVVPANSAHAAVGSEFSNPDGWQIAIRFYSMMYGMYVVMANRTGHESGLTFWGGSSLIDPFGHVVCSSGESETLLVSDVSYDAVRRARLQLPTVRDSNLALVGREIQRLQERLGIPETIRELPG
jgi:predicted amidohydrolase